MKIIINKIAKNIVDAKLAAIQIQISACGYFNQRDLMRSVASIAAGINRAVDAQKIDVLSVCANIRSFRSYSVK